MTPKPIDTGGHEGAGRAEMIAAAQTDVLGMPGEFHDRAGARLDFGRA